MNKFAFAAEYYFTFIFTFAYFSKGSLRLAAKGASC